MVEGKGGGVGCFYREQLIIELRSNGGETLAGAGAREYRGEFLSYFIIIFFVSDSRAPCPYDE